MLSVAPSINANVSDTFVDTPDDNVTPIALVFQLISNLRNHKDIQNVETEDDVLRIIEDDEEIKSIYEQISDEDCGCEDESTLEGNFPIICTILYPVFIFALYLYHTFGITFLGNNIGAIGLRLNCFWTRL